MHKDIRLARAAGTELATPLPTAAVADEILTRADQLGYGHRDIAALHEVLGQLSASAGAAT
jgi:3-hydroxyisobutyrate dehydrogenase-like beta-hydroxyacid dehydrogenase